MTRGIPAAAFMAQGFNGGTRGAALPPQRPTNEELLRDYELTQKDEGRLVAIVDNLQAFIADCGDENRQPLKTQLLVFQRMLEECRALLIDIKRVIAGRGLKIEERAP